MKTLKANRIEKEILSNKEMNQIRGGNTCGCGCLYADKGGSSTYDNANANLAENKFSGSDHDRIITIEVGTIEED